MVTLREWLNRLWGTLRRQPSDQEMEEELKLHLELAREDPRRRNAQPGAARREARLEAGGVAQAMEAMRDQRGLPWLEDFVRDLRHAIRLLGKSPGFTVIIVLSLAVGMGANTTVFSLFNTLFIRPLPYPDPDRLVVVWSTPPEEPSVRSWMAIANCVALRERTTVFQHIGCHSYVAGVFGEADSPTALAEDLQGERFSDGGPQALGVQPMMGRWFMPEEDDPGAEPVVLLSYSLWQRHFGGDADVIGRRVRVADGRGAEALNRVIGVMPESFTFANPQAEFWVPERLDPANRGRPTMNRTPIARLRPDVTLGQAQAEVDRLATSLAVENPELNEGWGMRVEQVQQGLFGDFRTPFLIFQAVVLLVLLAACANVAGLLLARGIAESREMALRRALGSSRRRIFSQSLTASAVVSSLGCALSLCLAWLGLRVLTGSLPEWFPQRSEISIDPMVLAFAVIASLGSALIFGIAPALHAAHSKVTDVLKGSASERTTSGDRRYLRDVFVVLQIAIAVVLMIGAGLMINSFLRLHTARIGVDPENLLSFQVRFDGPQFVEITTNTLPSGNREVFVDEQLGRTVEEIRQRLTRIGGVESATAVGVAPPLSGFTTTLGFSPSNRPESELESTVTAQWFPILPDYFRTLEAPVLRGREFTVQDLSPGAPPVVLIGRTMADRFWRGEDPIGTRIQLDVLGDRPREIVGIVADIRHNSREQDLQPQMYVPIHQLPRRQDTLTGLLLRPMTFIIRTPVGVSSDFAATLASTVTDVDATRVIYGFRPLGQNVGDQLQVFRQYVVLLSVFAGLALVLALIGIYGIMSHSVVQRTREIGIRVALGAASGHVLRVVLTRALVLIGIGIAVGLLASIALTSVIQSMLWGITATDPVTFGIVLLTVAAIALLASIVPARWALKVDPLVALRYQ